MPASLLIGDRRVAAGEPVYLIAEMSGNHNGSLARAEDIVRAAADSGADAVKLQTYTADTMTIDHDGPGFVLSGGTLWDGRTLHALYREAMTPWEWTERLMTLSDSLGLQCFSTPFDVSAVSFLDALDVPVFKVASLELVDIPLIRAIAATGRPAIMSTGMSSLAEVDDAVRAWRGGTPAGLSLLKCTSAYPAPPEEAHLRTIPHLAETFDVVPGLSDHTLGTAVPVGAVALGACVIEKHFTLSRQDPGPDRAFSLEPAEFRQMVDAVRTVEKALGRVDYSVTAEESRSSPYRRSLYAVADIAAGERLTLANVRSIRPAHGLLPKHLDVVLGRVATRPIPRGTPLSWELIG
jgi:pseudaminic acid synthase